ncbi:hypothetical protein NQD34_012351 [Periophthalmus magnuspinnatus]|uniref:Transmembrane protein 100 n=1 Tax=Periophthalmus magnuspinnatus TaxID=409849 RepID=A0A3B4BI82_9GOBI|nr:hypothetical protein NQD34_012351 [Periophthalmus magnuspinnatus]
MEILNPAYLEADPSSSSVTYDPKAETVTLPAGVVSVAGITVVTGGVELSCGSCMLAFGFWGTLISLSCISVGIWDQTNHSRDDISHLLALGLVILALSLVTVGCAVVFYLLKKQKKRMTSQQREMKEVLMEESGTVKKKVTV